MEAKLDPPADSREMVRRLADLIQAEKLAPGDRLPSIRALSASLDVSPSVVRDAMVQAQAMGLIKLHPRSGAFVQSLSFASIVDALSETLPGSLMAQDHNVIYLLDSRLVVERETVSQAAGRRRLEDMLPLRRAMETMDRLSPIHQSSEYVAADIDFHLGMARAAGNPVTTILLESLLGALRPYLVGLEWSQERQMHTERSHGVLYDAILKGNVDAARAAIERHIGLARETLLLELQAPIKTG